MIELKDGIYVHLAHVSAVGAIGATVGRPAMRQFMVHLLGGQSLAIKGNEDDLLQVRDTLLASLRQRVAG